MLIDSLLLRSLSLELSRVASSLRIEKIHQPEPDTLVLRLYPSPDKKSLVLCLDRALGHASLSSREFENPHSPPAFCSLLRKYLGTARLRAVRQPGLERILEFDLTAALDGRPASYTLVLELFGHLPNLYLVAADGRILGACRHYQQIERLASGVYVAPAPFLKPSILDVAEEIFLKAAAEAVERRAPKPLLLAFDGVGRGLARLLLDAAAADGPAAAWRWLAIVRASVALGVPAVAYRAAGDGVDPAVVPWMPAAPLPPGARLFESPSEAVEAYLGEGVGKMRLSRLRDELLGSLRRRRVRLEQRLERFLEDQERAREADLFERWGHLLQANPQAAGPYDSSAKLRDLFEPDAPEIEIPLRPGHTLAASAASLFNRARRLRRTAPAARLAEMGCRAELELVEQWSRDILRIADDARAAPQDALADLRLAAARIRDAGVSAEVPAAGKSGGRGRGRRQERPRFREFRSSDGLRILAGRTDRENDQLTTRAARRGDLWLHVHDAPGAHVVVKLAGAECPRATLVEAAQIAAFYSPNRYSAKATVAYTRSENVKKPPGARPGLVTLRSFQTLVVACDASVPAKLSGLRPNGAADAT